jgi:hypothetical protein
MTSRFFSGGRISDVALSNIDIKNILPKITKKSWSVYKYSDLTPDMRLPFYSILLYQYPNQIGHWVLIKCDDNKELLYFFDPYGLRVDSQWSYLENPMMEHEPRHVLSEIIHRYVTVDDYHFSYNIYNIQGTIRNGSIRDSECGEICLLRIIYSKLSDKNFYKLCQKLGGHKIFDIIKKIDEL